MNKAYLIKELTRTWISSGKPVKRCVLCNSDVRDLDKDCPVCRAIEHIKKKPNK